MNKPAITVVIPNWNGIDLIRECLQSLQKQTVTHSVIVVDNGSVDGSNVVVREEFPAMQLLEFPNNAGFAGGVNRGIKPALDQGAKYIVLFNNDAIADEHWLENLAASAGDHPEAGLITSKIRHFDDPRLDSTGDFYSTWAFPFPRGRDEVDTGQYDTADHQVVFGASGGASLYRADMLRQIGLFDERFFAYFEDVDISFRAQLAGWKVRYEPRAVVRHHIGGTSSRIDDYDQENEASTKITPTADADRPSKFARYHTVKNFHYIYAKNMPGLLYFKYLPLYWASAAMMLVSDIRRGLLIEDLQATLTALIHTPSILRDRIGIQRQREVSVAYIDSILYHGLPPLQMLRFRRLRKHNPAK